MTRWSVASIFVCGALLLTTVNGQQPQKDKDADSYVDGELLVQFSPTLNIQQRNAELKNHNLARLRRFDTLDIDLVRVPRGLSVAAAAGGLKNKNGILLVQPNYVRRAIVGPPPNDPFWLDGSMWGLAKIGAQSVWTNFTTGDGSVIVGDIDTGIDYTHPDLAANVWRNTFEIPGNGVDDDGNGYVDDVYGIDTANHDSDPMDDQGHGTHTAGTIAAIGNNNLGVVGVNWNAKVLSCKFLDASGSGTDAGAIECFNYMVAMRNRGENIRVTSNSWGAQRGSAPPAPALIAAIDAAGTVGIINIFGAGNDGMDNDVSPFDPASYPSTSIVSVASSGPTDRRSFFSNYGATSVDLAAPGENILSTYPGGDYQSSSGTSMSTPHVAGVAALLAKMDPSLPVNAIKALLLDNVERSSRWTGKVVSGGRLNAFLAASAVSGASNNVPPTVSIIGPAAGASFKAPINIAVEAAAADSDGTVQQVAFFANGAPIGTATASPFSVIWSPVPGNYTLTAVATDDHYGIATSAPVSVVILANAPPAVSITSPVTNTEFPAQSLVAIDATATDTDGGVQQVEFFVDGVSIGIDGSAPYSGSWNASIGGHLLKAVATDNQGATSMSTVVAISVQPLPGRINVARASNGGVATASSILGPKYPPSGAIDGDRKGLNWGNGGGWNDGTPNASPDWIQVDFAGMKLIEEVNVFSMQDEYGAPVTPTATMTFTLWGLRNFEVQYWDGSVWLPLPGGVVTNNNLVWRQTLFVPISTSKIRVFITAALNGSSRVMEVEAWGINSGANSPPSVAIASPAAGASFTTPASVVIDATASDTDGVVQQVDFYVDGALVGSDAAEPYSFTWSGGALGSHTLTAIATDNTGATTTSAPVFVTVTPPNTAPSVSISSPANGAAFTAPASIVVSASASDSDGTVASVEFFANGNSLGIDASAPFTAGLSGVAAATYVLTAVATDNSGETATSAPVTIAILAIPNRFNMALASNGGVATASSILNNNYPASGAINGDRRGLNWGAGGGWNDGTPNAGPDWIEVAFNGPKTIDEIDLFSMQDNYGTPVEPTPTMTFTLWGVRAFDVQYWTGTAWQAIPGTAVTNNNLIWRQLVFVPITTTRIRVNVTAALNGYARVIELEAWGIAAPVVPPPNTAPTVSITSPSAGASFTEPASITIAATAADADGSVSSVAFLANGAQVGSSTVSPFSFTWTGAVAGTYSLTAVATDNLGLSTTSAAVSVVVTAPTPRINVALAANGAVATASSQLNANYPPSGAINGDRRGVNWGAGGGWNDGTANTTPDWIEVAFNGSKTIDEVSVFSMQDNYQTPVEPTPTMTFGLWGLRTFEVQYWTGSSWATIPGATIVNNTLIWRRFTFVPVTTTRIRVHITGALNGYSRVIEVEAWGVPSLSPASVQAVSDRER
jgi:subtilisin family serine protease